MPSKLKFFVTNLLDEPVFIAKPMLTEFGIHYRLESCGYCLNRLDEPVFMAVPKPMLTEIGIHYRLESCDL